MYKGGGKELGEGTGQVQRGKGKTRKTKFRLTKERPFYNRENGRVTQRILLCKHAVLEEPKQLSGKGIVRIRTSKWKMKKRGDGVPGSYWTRRPLVPKKFAKQQKTTRCRRRDAK